MIDLHNGTLAQLPATVSRFRYDRARLVPGIVHLSVGNFHRAHQAWYLDQLFEVPGAETWALCGVGLLDDEPERVKATAFPGQDALYTLTLCPPDAPTTHQVIGSIVEYLFAPADPDRVRERMAAPEIRIVSMTITEGGYNQDKRTGAYRLDAPGTMAELATPAAPRSAFGFIVEALRRRRDRELAPFTVLSCDNLRNNGEVAKSGVLTHARALDPDLAAWIEAHVAFPSSMVDRITPATLRADAERINAATGVADLLPVFAEDFSQWVIEDRFCNGRPPLERVGAQMVDDVHPYELAKVRMLNGSHMLIGYAGQLAGFKRVDEAMREPLIRTLVERYMTADVIPLLAPPPGMELGPYRDKLVSRFANPSIGDQTARLSGDSAAKLPVYILPTLHELFERGASHRHLAFAIAAFFRYLGGVDDRGETYKPFEPNLEPADLALALDPDPRAAFRMSVLQGFGIEQQVGFQDDVVRFRAAIAERGTLAVLAELLGS